MARVKVNNTIKVRERATRRLSIWRKSRFLKDLGKITIFEQQSRARRGKQPNGKPMRKLSPGYQKSRRKLQVPKSKFFRPRATVSNVTLTGQLLNSLTNRLNIGRGQVTTLFTGVHKDLTKGKKKKENTTNAKLAKDLQERGFKFFGLSKPLRKQLNARTTEELRRELRNKPI